MTLQIESGDANRFTGFCMDTTIVRNEAILFAQVGDELVALLTDRGVYVSLDGVGSCIWELLEKPITISSLCEHLVARYEVASEICYQETVAFLADLEEKRMITRAMEAGARR